MLPMYLYNWINVYTFIEGKRFRNKRKKERSVQQTSAKSKSALKKTATVK